MPKQSFRSLDSTSHSARFKQPPKIFEKTTPLAPLDNLSFLNQTIITNNLQVHSKIIKKMNRNCHTEAEIEDDLNDEETLDTMTLRNNLNAKILTKGKDGLFNDKINQFNFDKNKNFPINANGNSFERPTVEMYVGTYRMTTDGMPQGPKNYFTTEIHSPKPKDNSLDEINEILFADLSDDECNLGNNLNDTARIPAKDYIEITEAFERNELRLPTRDTNNSPDKRLFSRGNDEDENCDYINLLAGDDGKSIEFQIIIIINTIETTTSHSILRGNDKNLKFIGTRESLRRVIIFHRINLIL